MKSQLPSNIRHITSSTTPCPNPLVPLRISSLPILSPSTLLTFQDSYFNPALPCTFPPSHFTSTLPAISQWFVPHPKFPHLKAPNTQFFHKTLGDRINALLLMEVSLHSEQKFIQIHAPFAKLLEDISSTGPRDRSITTYLAQCSIDEIPELKDTLPTPQYIHAGKGDVYNVNLWMGHAALIVTPLHKDPNPNLFVQLAGTKRVRMFEPDIGRRIMQEFGGGVKRFRMPDEMMDGKHREILEKVVWGEDEAEDGVPGFETMVGPGDGIFIPKGWWHAIRSVGEDGAVASVNWWFR
ncbi:Clavaminate synthase-like protein [Choiromyces venosus 120613-1]|uniref:Clavaminate synthase-like protein n=1 Tax=Choiromyces venosus 120613-1 TaxID=1336337 RepID=A0A3N4K437_9PEZI|nr:Clavaminate synthase-like protein [Choiromyces venosus 120613-1]